MFFIKFIFCFFFVYSFFINGNFFQISLAKEYPTLSKKLIKLTILEGYAPIITYKCIFPQYYNSRNKQNILIQKWDGDINKLSKLTHNKGYQFNLFMIEEILAEQACSQGILYSFNHQLSSYQKSKCSQPFFTDYITLAWDKHIIKDSPTWKEFWNVTLFPGKRGLRRDPRSTLEIALLADGVSSDKIYDVLATPSGIKRAFQKLDQLRPYIVWWNTPSEATKLLNNKSVLMTSASARQIIAFNANIHDTIGIQKSNALQFHISWIIPKNIDEKNLSTNNQLSQLTDQPLIKKYFPDFDSLLEIPNKSSLLLENNLFWQKHFDDLQQKFIYWLNKSKPYKLNDIQ